MRKINQFTMTVVVISAIILCAYIVTISEFKNIAGYDFKIAFVMPVIIIMISLANMWDVYKRNHSLNNRLLVISGLSFSLLLTSIFYPLVGTSISDKNFEEKFREELIVPLVNANYLGRDMINSGQYQRFSEVFMENNYTTGDYSFKIFPNESLQENISLSKNDNEYTTERLDSMIVFKDGTSRFVNGNVPEYYSSENMAFVYTEFSASSNLNKAAQIFPSMIVASKSDKEICFDKHMIINDTDYRKEEVCLPPNSRASFSIGINGQMFPQEIQKIRFAVELTEEYKSENSKWGFSNAEIRYDKKGNAHKYSDYCIEVIHTDFPSEKYKVADSKLQKGACP